MEEIKCEEVKKESKENKEIKTFENKDLGNIRVVLINDIPYFFGVDVATLLLYERPSKAVSDNCKGILIQDTFKNKGGYLEKLITESDMYRLIVKASTQSNSEKIKNKAEKFESWIFDDVLPTIRKTGDYINNDNLFIDTYLPFADDNTKLLFSTTLESVRKQNELIQKQKNEILHKQEVINGFIDDVDIYKKRVIINRICKRRYSNYANRYKELYKCFREAFHIDLEARCEGYNIKQIKRKDKLTTIAYAEKFGHIDDLYSCCVKLYETEVNEINCLPVMRLVT